jgi:hypothetical protein
VPFPKDYLIGIDLQQRDFEDYGKPSYLGGEFSEKGWWYFYLYAIAIKMPLGVWLVVMAAIACRLLGKVDWHGRDDLMLMAPPIAVFVAAASKWGFTQHMRYVLPCFPYGLIWVSQAVAVLAPTILDPRLSQSGDRQNSLLQRVYQPGLGQVALVAGIIWYASSSLWIYPHSLSYFNEAIGGPLNGGEHLLHSNFDWGQDVYYVREWRDKNEGVEPFFLIYYGYFNPADFGIEFSLPDIVTDQTGDETSAGTGSFGPGFYAVSATFLYGYPWHAPNGKGGRETLNPTVLARLRQRTPAARLGYSVFLYDVEASGGD